ncbi:pyruvate kinase [Patella vulgata]|uniref:pyruvate kinase n=1 Tax=Patella vulgata TaxID=6465 RepID=UPI002180754F|nr:pyruvate kinase [Patella vulgata]XP_050398748.1 pyruvate kinase [Patella vulgata]
MAENCNKDKRSGNVCNQHQTRLEHICDLNIDKSPSDIKKTGIICTIGPACDSIEMIDKLIQKGMRICRLNMVHSSEEYYVKVIENIRNVVAKSYEQNQVAIAIDITGPGARIGKFKSDIGNCITLKTGNKMLFTCDKKYEVNCDRKRVYVDQPEFFNIAEVGDLIFIEDGPLSLKVLEKHDSTTLICQVDNGGDMANFHQCHIPKKLPGKPVLTQRDKDAIAFALDNEVDMILASWVWCSSIIQSIRLELGTKADAVHVIAKIQNHEGVLNFDEILKVSDGILVGRGDLGIDIPGEKVFLAQKMMIGKANSAGKPVICAAQMLDSMVNNPRPTRAEASDVANAVLDGIDCIMLSRETAIGTNPVKVVETLSAICREAESVAFTDSVFRELQLQTPKPVGKTHTTAIAAVEAASKSKASAILVVTTSGRSAAMIAKYRPSCIIIAITRVPETARYLHLFRGVYPMLYSEPCCAEWIDDIDKRIHTALLMAQSKGFVAVNDSVVLVTGWSAGSGHTNTLRLITVPILTNNMESRPSLVKLVDVKSNPDI